MCSEWQTPLGNIPIDQAIVKTLAESSKAKFTQIPTKHEENEHSLEMHLPFIRKVFGQKDIKLVPLMVGEVPSDKFAAYADELLPYFMDERTLFVVSSDFCHWGEDFDYMFTYPDEPHIHKSIERLDREGMSLIEA